MSLVKAFKFFFLGNLQCDRVDVLSADNARKCELHLPGVWGGMLVLQFLRFNEYAAHRLSRLVIDIIL